MEITGHCGIFWNFIIRSNKLSKKLLKYKFPYNVRRER